MISRDAVVGTLFGLAVAVIWSSWAVATRYAVATDLGPADVTFLRFAVSGLILWPVLWRGGLHSDQTGLVSPLLMLAGAGVPFMLLASTGLLYAPATHIATLMIGVMPIWVALFSVWFLGDRLTRQQTLGIALVLAGVLSMGFNALFAQRASGEWKGDLLFLTAGALFAMYTITQRRIGISSWQAAAIVNVFSAILYTPVYLLLMEPRLLTASLQDVAVQALAQGVWVAVLGLYCYGEAVRRLGAARAAVFGALAPAMAAVMSAAFLGEIPAWATLAGVALVTAGVVAVVTGRMQASAKT